MSGQFMDYKTYDPLKEGFGSSYEWKRSFHHRMSKEEAETILEEEDNDPYDILEVTRRSSQAEIKKSFYRLAMKWHPDKNKDIDTTKQMQRISAAYSLLLYD